MESILYNIIANEQLFTKFILDPHYVNDDAIIKHLFNGITGLIEHLFTNSLLQTINSSEFGIYYLFADLLLLSHNGQSIFSSTLHVDDFELLLFSTKIYLSEEISKQLIGLIERVINFIDTELKVKSEYIIQHKSTPIWQKSLPELGLRDQVFNGQSYPNFFSSVGNAVEYLFGHLLKFKTHYLETLLRMLYDKKTEIDAVQTSLQKSRSKSNIVNTIGYKAVKLANKRKVVFENLVKKHCSHHYKYKSRTPNDGVDKYRSTRSYRTASMRRKKIGVLQKVSDPLYKNSDTISRNKKVMNALNLVNAPLNDKIIGVVGNDKKDRQMSQGRIERNKPDGVFMTNRLNAFKEMLSNETRKKRVFSRSKGSRKSRESRKRNMHSV
jgi:hypothetical protein